MLMYKRSKKLVEVPYWLIQMQLNEDARNEEFPDP